MASAEGESKPGGEEGGANPEHINLKVMGQDGNIVQFKIKKHTALKKLMSTYCERAGLALQTIRFSFDGTRINEADTPKGLDMEDGDTIEVFQQQSGGRVVNIDPQHQSGGLQGVHMDPLNQCQGGNRDQMAPNQFLGGWGGIQDKHIWLSLLTQQGGGGI